MMFGQQCSICCENVFSIKFKLKGGDTTFQRNTVLQQWDIKFGPILSM